MKEIHLIMEDRVRRCLYGKRDLVFADYAYTFEQLGLSTQAAAELCNEIFEYLEQAGFETAEGNCDFVLANEDFHIPGRARIDGLSEVLSEQADTVGQLVAPHLRDITGRIIDYGCGDGNVTFSLQKWLCWRWVEGVDVRDYVSPEFNIPFSLIEGTHVAVPDGTFEAGLIFDVLHHEADNEAIIRELDRIVSKRLVVLETVPLGDTERALAEDTDRIFMRDYLCHRLFFYRDDVPVPGTYETPEGWRRRFQKHGWHMKHEERLGIDSLTFDDRHHLFIFERV